MTQAEGGAQAEPDEGATRAVNANIAELPPHAPHPHQGNSPAAWTTVFVIVAGGLMAAFGLIGGGNWHWLSWTGLGVAILGVIVGKVLSLMGFGAPQAPKSPSIEKSNQA